MRTTLTRTACTWLATAACFGLATVAVNAQPAAVRIIPAPRQITMAEGSFPIGRNGRVLLVNAASAEDRFAAEDLAADLKATADMSMSIGKGRSRDAILIGTIDLPPIAQALKQNSIDLPSNFSDEGYVLIANAEGIVIAGKGTAGTFYGVQTLKQLVQGEGKAAIVPALKIIDWPTMRWRGVSDDISRGPVPTVDYIKRQIRTEAFFKLNMHSFYMEHTFSSPSHPLIGPEGGSLTPSEIRELVTYARKYHVELVPEQQTFGHLHKALRLEKYADLAETPYGDVLSPQQAGSYRLVDDWYKELNELFPGQFFHIGSDETFELGEGQSRAQAQAKGVGPVYFEHLNRVRELLRPYNKRLMFWGDIALNHPNLI